jgi:steroid 5-alpha reductase family enzyme
MSPITPWIDLLFNFTLLLGFGVIYFSLCWLWARRLNNYSIVDVAWTFGFSLISGYFFVLHYLGEALPQPGLMMAGATLLWSLRLGTHLTLRVFGHLEQEDGRYLKMRQTWGAETPQKMWCFYMLQAFALALLCLPLLSSFPFHTSSELHLWHWIGLGVVISAMLLEGLADAELSAFKKDPANRGKVCSIGLWSWSRHPNYFAEWLVWLGFLLMSYNQVFFGLPGLLCALLMYHLLTKVTGIPLTEQQLLASKGEAYIAYQAKVSAFWPRPPKK